MKTLIFIFLVWLPLALALDTLVRTVAGEISQWYKKALFFALTFPAFWIRLLDRLVEDHVAGKLPRIGGWFKS